jgi:hypothetical protein
MEDFFAGVVAYVLVALGFAVVIALMAAPVVVALKRSLPPSSTVKVVLLDLLLTPVVALPAAFLFRPRTFGGKRGAATKGRPSSKEGKAVTGEKMKEI